MFRALILSIITLLIGSQALAGEKLDNRLSYLLPHSTRWELVTVELAGRLGTTLAGNAVDTPLAPASLAKLFTTGAALAAEHGPSPALKTLVLHDGTMRDGVLNGNIYLKGGGNPFLSAPDLQTLARRLREKGINRITGDIVADDTLFDVRGLERTRKGPGHAPAGALGLDLHTVAVIVAPTEPGVPPTVTAEPDNKDVLFAVSARTAPVSANSIVVAQIDDISYKVSGNIEAGSSAEKRRFPLSDPARYAAGVFATAMEQAGIEREGKVTKGPAPDSVPVLAGLDGPPLEQYIRDMNVNSLNVAADNLLLFLGAQRYGLPGTREKGIQAVGEFAASLGFSPSEVQIADGSGLSEQNRVTVRAMVRYLAAASKKEWFAPFRDSLPRAGMDGTLRSFGFRNERFRVKTGRLENVYALAGYGVDAAGKEIAFAFIANGPGVGMLPNIDLIGAEILQSIATGTMQ